MSVRKSLTVLCSIVVSFAAGVSAQYGPYASRGLLEKKLYYVDEEGKTGMCSFWSMHLGKHSCNLVKEFPGEGKVTLAAEVNFNFLSSLYIEGKGYSNRGKVDAEAKFAVADGDSLKTIEPEQIEFVTDYGAQVKYSGGELTGLILLSQDNRLSINRLLVRSFYMDKETKELKADKDIAIKAFAFSKEDLAKAIKIK